MMTSLLIRCCKILLLAHFTAAVGGVVHHFTATSGPLVHATTLQGAVTSSSTLVMATTPQPAPSATLHHREGMIFASGQPIQSAVITQVCLFLPEF